MKHDCKKLGVTLVLVIILSIGVPTLSPNDIVVVESSDYFEYASAGNVTNVQYVWQELNGFCHWAAFSMILQSAGVPLDLYDVFAATGIGFSASYLRLDTNMVFFPGPFFPQMPSTFAIADIFGVNITMHLDRTVSGNAGIFASNLEALGVEFTEITGFDEAFELLKETIDSGYPFEIWSDPYYLPPWDYDIVRDQDVQYQDSSVGHAIVATGYNETAGTVHIFDPGVGAFGELGYPSDGRYSYDLNLTQLDSTWAPLFYGSFTVKPGEGIPDDKTTRLGNHILNRMRGDRSYLANMEDAYFWTLGSDAYRGLAYDLTASGLTSFIDEFGSLTPLVKSLVLQDLGLITEGLLAIQYLSFKTALQALPELLSNLELSEFVTAGNEVIEHLEAISDNATMAEIDYEGGATITTDTFNSLAYDCQYKYGGDVADAVSENEEGLNTIREHLFAIADAWDATADALDVALNGNATILVVGVVGVSAFVCIVSVVAYRRRKV